MCSGSNATEPLDPPRVQLFLRNLAERMFQQRHQLPGLFIRKAFAKDHLTSQVLETQTRTTNHPCTLVELPFPTPFIHLDDTQLLDVVHEIVRSLPESKYAILHG